MGIATEDLAETAKGIGTASRAIAEENVKTAVLARGHGIESGKEVEWENVVRGVGHERFESREEEVDLENGTATGTGKARGVMNVTGGIEGALAEGTDQGEVCWIHNLCSIELKLTQLL